ncbi:hypothetical protein TWF281_002916 [Arthrobotrys megalospora]
MAVVVTDIEPILKRDWTGEVRAGPAIVEALGSCNAHTALTSIMVMEVGHGKLPKSLLENLLIIENMGQKAFRQAHLDCETIAICAHSIGKTGGYIDKVRDSYGKDALQRRLQRAMDSLERQANDAQESAKKTLELFEEWEEQTELLAQAVAGKVGSTKGKVEKAEREVHQAEQDVDVAKNSEITARENLDNARQRSVEAASSRKAFVDRTSAHSMTFLGLITAFFAGARADTARCDRVTEREYRDAVENFEHSRERLEESRRKWASKREDLKITEESRDTLKNIHIRVNDMLQELRGLQRNVTSMVGFFQKLSGRVRELASRYRGDVKKVSEENDKTEESREDLHQYSKEVKVLCLVVYTISSVYSRVSYDYVMPGFEKISRLTNYSSDELSPEEQIKRSKGEMRIYRDDAEAGITQLVEKAKMSVWEEVKREYPEITDASPLNPGEAPPEYEPTG